MLKKARRLARAEEKMLDTSEGRLESDGIILRESIKWERWEQWFFKVKGDVGGSNAIEGPELMVRSGWGWEEGNGVGGKLWAGYGWKPSQLKLIMTRWTPRHGDLISPLAFEKSWYPSTVAKRALDIQPRLLTSAFDFPVWWDVQSTEKASNWCWPDDENFRA